MKKVILGFSLVFTTFLASAGLDDGLIAYWKMEQISGGKVLDVSGNGRDLTPGGGCALTNGINGSALAYDGTAAAFASFRTPAVSGSKSFAAWVRLEKSAGPAFAGRTRGLFSMLLSHSCFKLMFAYDDAVKVWSDAKLTVYLDQDQTYTTPDRSRTLQTYNQPWPLGDWHHFAVTHEHLGALGNSSTNLANIRIYKDGILYREETNCPIGRVERSEENAILGNFSTDPENTLSRPLFGAVDNVRLYDRVLSSAEINRMIAEEANLYTVERLGYWKMDEIEREGETRRVRDASGKGNDLTLLSSATLTNGFSGTALWFDGTTNTGSRFTLPELFSAWSISFWMNAWSGDPQSLVTGNRFGRILCGVGGVGGEGRVEWRYTESPIGRPFVRNFGTVDDTSAEYINLGTSMFRLFDTWTHVVFTVTNGYNEASGKYEWSVSVYRNGEKIATGATRNQTYLLSDPATVYYIGNSKQGGNRPLVGAMDDVSFYKGILSDDDVRTLYRSAMTVSAGTARTVAGGTVPLDGTVTYGEAGVNGVIGTMDGTWSVVSVPDGVTADLVKIRKTDALHAKAVLPANGEYVFLLSMRDAFGGIGSATVTVTRVSAPAENQPPQVTLSSSAYTATGLDGATLSAQVSDPDQSFTPLAVKWSKVSGPGGIYFTDDTATETVARFTADGDYVVCCEVSDGIDAVATTATVTVTGAGRFGPPGDVAHYWPEGAETDVITRNNSFYLFRNNGASLTNGITKAGSATRCITGSINCVAKSSMPKFDCSGKVTVSFWMYYDAANYINSAFPHIFQWGNSFGIQYDAAKSPRCLRVIGWDPSNALMNWLFNADVGELENKWAHVAAVFDFVPSDDFVRSQKMYINGRERTIALCYTNTSSSAIREADSNKLYPFRGFNTTNLDATMYLLGQGGGIRTDGNWGVMPGRMCEVRIYERGLSADEIRALSAYPAGWENHAPIAERVGNAALRVSSGTSVNLAVNAYDDGLPAGTPLSYNWRVVTTENLTGPLEKIEFSGMDTREMSLCAVGISGTVLLQCKVSDGALASWTAPVRVTIVPCGMRVLLR